MVEAISNLGDRIFFVFLWWHDSITHSHVHAIRRIVKNPRLGRKETFCHALWAAAVRTRRENRVARLSK